MMKILLKLMGFLPEAIELVESAIRHARRGDAQRAAYDIQRAAEVQAFKIRHGWRPGKGKE